MSSYKPRRPKNNTTKLPSSLEDVLREQTTNLTGERLTHKQQKELDKRFKFSYSKKQVFGRKEERKQKRLDKKRHRVEAIEKRSQKNKEKANPTKTSTAPKPPAKPVTTPAASKDQKKPALSSTVQDDAATTRKKLEKIQQKNPALFKMLQSTSVGIETGLGGKYGLGGGVGAWSADGTTLYDKDDEDIEYYSRKLGKAKTYKNSLKKDGLDGEETVAERKPLRLSDLYESLDQRTATTASSSFNAESADTSSAPAAAEKISDLQALQQRPSKSQLAAAAQKAKEEKEAADKKKEKKGENRKASKVVEVIKKGKTQEDDADLPKTKSKKSASTTTAAATSSTSRKSKKPVPESDSEEEDEEDRMDLDLAGDSDEEGDDFGLGLGGFDDDDEEDDSEDDFDFGSDAEVSEIEMNMADDDDELEEDEEDENDVEGDNQEDDDEEMVESDEQEEKTSTKSKKAVVPKEENSVSSAPAGKYIPPRLRAKVENKSEQYMRLKRQIQGLLNRLSDSNIESIVTGLEECYRNNSRHDVTEIITDATIGFISNHANLLDSFVMTYAALLSCIFNFIGIEFGAHLTQTAVELYIKSMDEFATAEPLPSSEEEQEKATDHPSKRATNLVTLLSHLYNFSIIGAPLIYDLVRSCLDRMLELDVEIILKLLRGCGTQMRSDDPSALKDIVALVHEKSVKKVDPAFNTPRVKFMIETIMDLKNNKYKTSKKITGATGGASGQATGLQQEKLTKFISGLLRRRGVPDREPLRATLDDIKNVRTKGKWWLVGAAWAGHQEDGSTVRVTEVKDVDVTNLEDGAAADLLKLAKAQRMTTDIRRSIFVALMSAEDFVDAYEKLMRLGLKQKQEREIVRVLLHCCTNEKTYNPYYYLVATKFCGASHGFKITFQYALWDSVREFETGTGNENDNEDEDTEDRSVGNKTLRRVSHLAKFYSALVAGGFLGLTILKSLDFSTMGMYPALWCQLFFTHLMVIVPPASSTNTNPDTHVKGIFDKLKALKESMDLCEGIEFFLEQYVVPRGKEGKPRMGVNVDSLGISVPPTSTESLADILKKRGKIVREVLVDDSNHYE
ncbi:UNVERIFIED_CONTAM: suppressor of glycerol defect [Siphonaria sp. JEL0065]|nr:suppressor of glycerol defect [Siphonaria sp. JEL0065]